METTTATVVKQLFEVYSLVKSAIGADRPTVHLAALGEAVGQFTSDPVRLIM